jgi:hypothetical protein
MKKYIFTENQIKKVLDSIVAEQTMGSSVEQGNLTTMQYNMVRNKNPKFIEQIKKQGIFSVIDFMQAGSGITLNGKKIAKGQIIKPQTQISLPMSSTIIISGMGISQGQITFGQNGLEFSDYVA